MFVHCTVEFVHPNIKVTRPKEFIKYFSQHTIERTHAYRIAVKSADFPIVLF